MVLWAQKQFLVCDGATRLKVGTFADLQLILTSYILTIGSDF